MQVTELPAIEGLFLALVFYLNTNAKVVMVTSSEYPAAYSHSK